jgi:hypothetical protein
MYIVKLTVGSSRGATVGIVTELVDVHATLSTWVVAGDVPGDGSWGGLVGLLEVDGTLDTLVTFDLCNCRAELAWTLHGVCLWQS